MSYADFQAEWENAADAEPESYLRRSAAGLVADARAGRYGDYYQLWRAIAARATLPLAGPVLLEVLRSDADYLVRYHAATALLSLLGPVGMEAVDLSAGRAGQDGRLKAVEQMVRERLDAADPA